MELGEGDGAISVVEDLPEPNLHGLPGLNPTSNSQLLAKERSKHTTLTEGDKLWLGETTEGLTRHLLLCFCCSKGAPGAGGSWSPSGRPKECFVLGQQGNVGKRRAFPN